jgi:predicted MFS family arabinose efflux permease
VATQLAGRHRAGAAVSVVFGGLTIALALGVPLGTYIGSLLSWQSIFMRSNGKWSDRFHWIAMLMPTDQNDPSLQANAMDGLKAMFNPLHACGSRNYSFGLCRIFCPVYVYFPILLQVTHVDERTSSLLMLVYGVMAAIGNVWGGRLTDKQGADRAVMTILIGLAIVLFAMWFSVSSLMLMALFIGLLEH